MWLIADRSFDMSSQNATDEEKTVRANAWAEELYPIIPRERLSDSFSRAFQDHKSTFPINAYDLKAAWERISAEEVKAREERLAAYKAENPVECCTEPGRHINEHGDTEVLLGGPGGSEIIVPCPICRPVAHQTRMAEERSKLGFGSADGEAPAPEVSKKVVELMTEAAKRRIGASTFDRNDPIAIIDGLIKTLGEAVRDERGEYLRENNKRGWELLIRVKGRLVA